MATFVNYYPCSYGDSLINMFLGKNNTRQNNLITASNPQFKLLPFYNLKKNEQEKILKNIENKIYACHRQNQFDFGSSHKVVSIQLDKIDFLPERFKQIHLNQFGGDICNPILKQLVSKLPLEEIIKLDYQTWSKKNILSSDILLPISMLWNKEMLKNFCDKFNFVFDPMQVEIGRAHV